jgi:hypothetical protein
MRAIAKTVYVLLIVLLTRCSSFEKEEKLMGEYKLNDGNILELRYIGYGASTENVIRVNKRNPKENTSVMVEQIKGFDNNYQVEFNQMNDTLVKVTLIDTSNFKGKRMDWEINLNKRANQK